MRLPRLVLAAVVVSTGLCLPAGASNNSSAAAPVPTPGRSDSTWSESYIPTGDGLTTLHADILRPKGIAWSTRTPVVMTVSPYTNHSNQAATDVDPTRTGPSTRFYDFLDASKILSRGYTYVIVDLPGFGGSGGCNDWGGPVEQGAVKTAVEWAAARSWSNGRVGLLGKSYDAWTGLMGAAQRARGLAAVIAMEPVYSGYRYLYSDGVRFINSVATGALFQGLDALPGTVNDTPQYHASGAPRAHCYAPNYAQQAALDDPTTDFWKARDLVPLAKSSTAPLFLTQGFLEDNTKPDAAFAYFKRYAGPKHAWFGQFEHVRGYERKGGRELTGRTEFIAQANWFLDRWLKRGKTAADPVVEVQDGDGHWRPEAAWPPRGTGTYTTRLATGSYVDDGQNNGSGSGGGLGIWSISQPLTTRARYVGEATVTVTAGTTLPRANLTANTYDIAPDGKAVLLGRAAMLLRETGEHRVTLRLYGQDWVLPAGHRIGVLVSAANAEWYAHVPTGQNVTIAAASVGLPFLTRTRSTFLRDGESTPRLEAWRAGMGTITVPASTIASAERRFSLPG